MRLSHITVQGFKSFAKKTTIDVTHQVTGVVGPNGSGKSNIAEAIRFVLGEQSMKSMRGKIGADIIFKGSEQLGAMSRASVTMVIDNKNKGDNAHASQDLAPFLVYDELTLSRVIYADGTSDYVLNDAKIRLKDVQELLSFAGIGSSAHTIINQGEADRILLASPKDRKEALEDALGLRVYHMRLNESKRKLDRVKTHVREVELLRTEIKPHLTHLERQVKKIESEAEERKNLHRLLVVYLTREEKELELLSERIKSQGTSTALLLITDSIHKELQVLKGKKHDTQSHQTQEKYTLQAELRSLHDRRDQVTKTLGRLEAEKSYIEKELAKLEDKKDIIISHDEWAFTHKDISQKIKSVEESLDVSDIDTAKKHTEQLSLGTESFFTKYDIGTISKKESLVSDIARVTASLQEYEEKESSLENEIIFVEGKIEAITTQAEAQVTTRHEEEKKVMLLESKLRELESTIALRKQEEGEVSLRRQHFESLIEEGVMIVGRVVLDYKKDEGELTVSLHEKYKNTPKHDLLRAIERSKLRIEEASVPNREEIITEYKTTKERDEYLIKELADIQETEGKLLVLIGDLEESLETKFKTGMTSVSKVFSDFFGEVFPGGKGKLTLIQLVKIDDEGNQITEQGIDIDVSLPNKKVKEVNMFSGGERALVAIALLFAMSAITPPPFMVLDETDAPLDETNARKYGVMLRRLSENSKLLVITHNRETMNHCDMLYGVTLGVDGASRLLSIDFKQAENLVK